MAERAPKYPEGNDPIDAIPENQVEQWMRRDDVLRSIDTEVKQIEQAPFQTPESKKRLEELDKKHRRVSRRSKKTTASPKAAAKSSVSSPEAQAAVEEMRAAGAQFETTAEAAGAEREVRETTAETPEQIALNEQTEENIRQALANAERVFGDAIEARVPPEHRNFLLRLGDRYRRLPFGVKLAIGGTLLGIGFIGVGIGGAAGAGLAGLAIGTGRVLSGLGMYATLNALAERRTQNVVYTQGLPMAAAVVYGVAVPKIFAALDQNWGLSQKGVEWAEKYLFAGAENIPIPEGSMQGVADTEPTSEEVFGTPPSETATAIEEPVKAPTPETTPTSEEMFGVPPSEAVAPPAAVIETAKLPSTYEVRKGDTLYKILRTQFPELQGLSGGRQTNAIENILAEMRKNPADYGVASGNLDTLKPGQTVDLEKIRDILNTKQVAGQDIAGHAQNLTPDEVTRIESYRPEGAGRIAATESDVYPMPETAKTLAGQGNFQNEYQKLTNAMFNNADALKNPAIRNFVENTSFSRVMAGADYSSGYAGQVRMNLSAMLRETRGTPAFERLAEIVGYKPGSFLGIFSTEHFGEGLGNKSTKTVLEEVARWKIEYSR